MLYPLQGENMQYPLQGENMQSELGIAPLVDRVRSGWIV